MGLLKYSFNVPDWQS